MRRAARALSASAVAVAALAWLPAPAQAAGFLPGAEGFEAVARADGGAPDTLAGSHPYALTATLAFGAGSALSGMRLDLPPGLILNPAALPKCTAAAFHTPRSSPFEASRSGESCPDASQVGTVAVESGSEGVRRFGLFNLSAEAGTAAQLGFAPFGRPVVLDATLRSDQQGAYAFSLRSSAIPQALEVQSLGLALWGIPWAASHDGERGDCLNETEPAFPWAKCSLGRPSAGHQPRAFLSLPTACEGPLSYAAGATLWGQAGEAAASYESRGAGGAALPLGGCASLRFDPHPVGQLTDAKASSASGYSFGLLNVDEGLTSPSLRVASQVRRAVVTLPEGVNVNPSVGAGLEGCTPAQYAAETAFSPQGAGCPNGAKIGEFTVRTPLFEGELEGAVYLAQPDDPTTAAPGAENPFDTLIAVYLVTRSPRLGILVKVAGEIVPDPATGRLTASFDELPQLPYTELAVHFRPGQRAPLVTPASCGAAITAIEMDPWAVGALIAHATTSSPIGAGIGGGPCPAGSLPPFVAGSGGGRRQLQRRLLHALLRPPDPPRHRTGDHLLLAGAAARDHGKLAGIPFCSDAAIAAARGRRRGWRGSPTPPARRRAGSAAR